MTPNAFAWIALFGWPAAVFVFCRTLPPAQALIWSIVGGYLLLPFAIGVDFPMLPSFDKNSIPALSFLLLYPLLGRGAGPVRRTVDPTSRRSVSEGRDVARADNFRARGRRHWSSWVEWLLVAMMLLGPALTVMTNPEPFTAGPRFVRGLGAYDGLAMALSAIMALLPYLLARWYLAGEAQQWTLLKGFVIAGIAYSMLALIEIRLSPQLNRWVYGYLFQDFDQAMRDGGFRPVVFLQHGLLLAIFLCVTILSAFAVWRGTKVGKWLAAGVWLLAVLVLARSLGALALTLVFLPVLLFFKPRTQIVVAALAAMIVLIYPAVRASNLVPVQQIADFANSISEERSRSLVFRLMNEDELMARASEKPIFGWGSEGRSRIFDETGKDVSITDGLWIIILGGYGWVGYIGQFGLLTFPIVILAFRKRLSASRATAGLCVALAANVFDLIPNSGLTPVTWLIAGSLMAAAVSTPTAIAPTPPAEGPPAVPVTNPYGRQPGGRQRLRA